MSSGTSVLGASGARLGLMRLGAVADAAPPAPPEDVLVRFRRAHPELSPPVPAGRIRRTRAPHPADQTPIMPPARRYGRGDFVPPEGLQGRTRMPPPHPDFVADDPQIAPRRYSGLLPPGPPPDQGRARRSRPVLNDIGADLPVHPSRKSVGQIIPFPGTSKRSRLPLPPPEPAALPPKRLLCQTPCLSVALLWAPPVARQTFLSAAASPIIPEPCPYRPGAVDEAEGLAARPDEQDSQGQARPEDADYLPSRIDECS